MLKFLSARKSGPNRIVPTLTAVTENLVRSIETRPCARMEQSWMPSWLASARIDAHAVHHLVGDVLLGDDANHVVGTGPTLPLHHDPHDCLVATEPGDHVEHRGPRSHDRVVSLCQGAKRNVA